MYCRATSLLAKDRFKFSSYPLMVSQHHLKWVVSYELMLKGYTHVAITLADDYHQHNWRINGVSITNLRGYMETGELKTTHQALQVNLTEPHWHVLDTSSFCVINAKKITFCGWKADSEEHLARRKGVRQNSHRCGIWQIVIKSWKSV